MSIAKMLIALLSMVACASSAQAIPQWYFDACFAVAGSSGSSPAPSPSYWTPSNMTTIAWYDASLTNTITHTDGVVNQWNDIGSSATYHLAQTLAASKPTTGTRTLNSLNVLDCDGSDHMNETPFPVPTNGNLAIFSVNVIDTINNSADSLFALDSTNNDFQYESGNATQFIGRLNVSGIGVNVSLTNGPYAGPSIYNLNFDYTGIGAYNAFIDGTKRSVDQAYSVKLNTPQTLYVMKNRGSSQPPDGAVAEVILVEPCDETCRQKIEGYLAHKWGIADNLPSGHPYKTTAPTQ